MFWEKGGAPGVSCLISAFAAWLLCACVTLSAATLAANAFGIGERGLGFLSSAVSFLCAAAAGVAAAGKTRDRSLFISLIVSTALVIPLLTIGFLIGGGRVDPSPLLSLVSFTYTGVLFGMMILYRPKKAGGTTVRRAARNRA